MTLPAPPADWPRVQLGGTVTDLMGRDEALALIMDHARSDHDQTLGVVSINLDHLHHFGSAQAGIRDARREIVDDSIAGGVRWLALLDGAPLAKRAAALTGQRWPRLAGSDLIDPILDQCEKDGLSVGFLGGAEATHRELEVVMAKRWPQLRLAGCWAPSRAELADPDAAARIAATIKKAGVDVLAVCLGKPRQEQWIGAYGHASGAGVALAFGAVVDFVAGRVNRAPRFVADHGLEWAWRLAMEPRRLARRYLIQGPPAYLALQRDSHVLGSHRLDEIDDQPVGGSIIVPAHNEGAVIGRTLAPISTLTASGTQILVAANGCTDQTVERARAVPGITVLEVPTAGKTAALNYADEHASGWPRLYLDADISITPEAVRAVFVRLADPRVLAARPAFEYDTRDCDRLAAAYYRARGRMPAMHEHLWGAGAYALGEQGHQRLGRFPAVTADDLFVDELFTRDEIAIVETTPVLVRCPRTAAALLTTLRRVQGGKLELARDQQVTRVGGVKTLVAGVRGPLSAFDAVVYLGFAVASRLLSRTTSKAWHRDETSRIEQITAASRPEDENA